MNKYLIPNLGEIENQFTFNNVRYPLEFINEENKNFFGAIKKPEPEDGKVIEIINNEWIIRNKTEEEINMEIEQYRTNLEVTPRQLRLALVDFNIMPSTIAAILGGIQDEISKEKANIEWEYSSLVQRNHALISGVAQVLNLSDEQVDAIFEHAKTL
jgi:hypothetical protein